MRAEHDHISLTDALAMTHANGGRTLLELSRTDGRHEGLLLVFLRHLGCTFCREALADIARRRARIEGRHVRIALVHMAPDADAAAVFARYGLADLPRVSDPDRSLYRAFELPRGTRRQLFGPKCVLRGFTAGVLARHGVGRLAGDGFQMPGVFLIQDGVVARAFRHDSAADRPDYCAVAAV